MAVVKTSTYAPYYYLVGTLAEVVEAMANEGVRKSDLVTLLYDSGASKWTAVYYRGQ